MGGENRTHGQVEQYSRIDSFDAGECRNDGCIMAGDIALECNREVVEFGWQVSESVELWHPSTTWSVTIKLERVQNGFGGDRPYFVCPCCGELARYLYFKARRFVCRKCAELNYSSQQETKDSMYYFRTGMKYARDQLRWIPPFRVCALDFPYLVPPRPRYMHESTYRKKLRRFQRYQIKYTRKAEEELTAVLGRFGRHFPGLS